MVVLCKQRNKRWNFFYLIWMNWRVSMKLCTQSYFYLHTSDGLILFCWKIYRINMNESVSMNMPYRLHTFSVLSDIIYTKKEVNTLSMIHISKTKLTGYFVYARFIQVKLSIQFTFLVCYLLLRYQWYATNASMFIAMFGKLCYALALNSDDFPWFFAHKRTHTANFEMFTIPHSTNALTIHRLVSSIQNSLSNHIAAHKVAQLISFQSYATKLIRWRILTLGGQAISNKK